MRKIDTTEDLSTTVAGLWGLDGINSENFVEYIESGALTQFTGKVIPAGLPCILLEHPDSPDVILRPYGFKTPVELAEEDVAYVSTIVTEAVAPLVREYARYAAFGTKSAQDRAVRALEAALTGVEKAQEEQGLPEFESRKTGLVRDLYEFIEATGRDLKVVAEAELGGVRVHVPGTYVTKFIPAEVFESSKTLGRLLDGLAFEAGDFMNANLTGEGVFA